jgi:hypothetical protein
LNTLVPDLDARTCKELARLLERMDANRDPLQVTWDQERIWALGAGGTLERIRNRIVLFVSRRNLQTVRQKAEPKFARIQFQERDLMLHLAARAYQLEHGKAPEPPGHLVPEYLLTIPQGPGHRAGDGAAPVSFGCAGGSAWLNGSQSSLSKLKQHFY